MRAGAAPGVRRGRIKGRAVGASALGLRWLERVCKGKPSYKRAHSAICCLDAPLSAKLPKDLCVGEIEGYLDEKTRIPGEKPLGPQAVNHLRSFLRRTFKGLIKR